MSQCRNFSRELFKPTFILLDEITTLVMDIISLTLYSNFIKLYQLFIELLQTET